MLKKDIIGGLFTRDDFPGSLFMVFNNDEGWYDLCCLNKFQTIISNEPLNSIKEELKCGYTLIGRFEELDIESLIQEKTY